MLASPLCLAAAAAIPQVPSVGDVAVLQLSGDDTLEAIGVWIDAAEETRWRAEGIASTAETIHWYSQNPLLRDQLPDYLGYYATSVDAWPESTRGLAALGLPELRPTTVTFPAFGVGTGVVDLPGLRFEDLVPDVGASGLPNESVLADWPLHADLLRVAADVATELADELLRAQQSIAAGQSAPYVDPSQVHAFDLPPLAAADRARRTGRAARRFEPYFEVLAQLAFESADPLTPPAARARLDSAFQTLIDFVDQSAESTRVDGLQVLTGAELGLIGPDPPATASTPLPKLDLTAPALGLDAIGVDIATQVSAANVLASLDIALDSVAAGAGSMFAAELKALDIAIDSVGGSGASMPGA